MTLHPFSAVQVTSTRFVIPFESRHLTDLVAVDHIYSLKNIVESSYFAESVINSLSSSNNYKLKTTLFKSVPVKSFS